MPTATGKRRLGGISTVEQSPDRHRHFLDHQSVESDSHRPRHGLPQGVFALYNFGCYHHGSYPGPSEEAGVAATATLPGSHRLRRVIPFDRTAAELAGRIAGDLERTGQPIGLADPMIAAIALQHNLELISGNTAHFQRVQQLGYPLTLGNWRM